MPGTPCNTIPTLQEVLDEYMASLEHDDCPKHGEQRVIRESSIGGVDPYAVNHLACGHRVVCFGPGEDNVII